MTSLSRSLVDNLSGQLHSDKCKDRKSKLDYMSVKDNQSFSVLNAIPLSVKSIIIKIVVKN